MVTKKSEAVVRDIKRRTRRKYSAEEKITIVLEGLRGEHFSYLQERRHRSQPLLPVDKGLPGGRQETPSGGYAQRS